MNLKNINIIILYGGWSHETEYTAHKEIEQAVKQLGLQYSRLSINDQNWIDTIIKYKPDVVFITNQGNYGEDGKIQAILDVLDIRYIGSGVLASAIGMNKYILKKISSQMGILTPKYMLQRKNSEVYPYETISNNLGNEFIIKPVSNGASVGVTLIKDRKKYNEIINKHINCFGDILLEQFINHPKKEVGLGILEVDKQPMILPACFIEYTSEYFSNEIKFSNDNVRKKYDLHSEVSKKVANLSMRLYLELGCSGMARFDFICDGEEKLYLLELNTLPGLLKSSIFPNECNEMGITYLEMVKILIISAFNKKAYSVHKI